MVQEQHVRVQVFLAPYEHGQGVCGVDLGISVLQQGARRRGGTASVLMLCITQIAQRGKGDSGTVSLCMSCTSSTSSCQCDLAQELPEPPC